MDSTTSFAINETGCTHGTWRVDRRDGRSGRRACWLCTCLQCGYQRRIAGVELRNRTPPCPQCLKRDRPASPPEPVAKPAKRPVVPKASEPANVLELERLIAERGLDDFLDDPPATLVPLLLRYANSRPYPEYERILRWLHANNR